MNSAFSQFFALRNCQESSACPELVLSLSSARPIKRDSYLYIIKYAYARVKDEGIVGRICDDLAYRAGILEGSWGDALGKG